MNAKHTPGPWKVVGTEIWSEKSDGVCGKVLGNVGGSYGEKDHRIRQANARLIAAGPELLEALVKLRTHVQMTHITPDKKLVKIVYNANSKAEGTNA